MAMLADFRSKKNLHFDHIELAYSAFFWISGNNPWFCRIWKKGWIDSRKQFGEAYGRNKFEAYRKALKDLGHNKMQVSD
jgi:hypothetical protein